MVKEKLVQCVDGERIGLGSVPDYVSKQIDMVVVSLKEMVTCLQKTVGNDS